MHGGGKEMAGSVNKAGNPAHARKGLWGFLKSRKGQKIAITVAFMLIPLFLLLLFTYYPFLEMIKFSFYKIKTYAGYNAGNYEFVGLKNYIDLFKKGTILSTLKNSLYYLVGALIQTVLALYLATVLSFKVKGGNIFKGIMFFPYLISGIAIGFIFKFFFTPGFGFDSILGALGFAKDSLPNWLGDKSVNNIVLASTSVWRYCGQNMVLFIGAIMSIDSGLYEASMLDGANRFQQFRYIILPGIKTILTLNVILAISGSLSAFEQPWVITGGNNGTETYFTLMHKMAQENKKIGMAAAMAIVLFIIILIVTLLQKLVFKIFFDNYENEVPNATLKRDARITRIREKKAKKGAGKPWEA